MNNWGANHGAFNYGHIGADLITLRVDAAHPRLHAQRAEDDKIFRPSAWAAFGIRIREGVGLPRLQKLRRPVQIEPESESAIAVRALRDSPNPANVPRIVRFSGRFHTLPLCTGAPPHEPTDAHD